MKADSIYAHIFDDVKLPIAYVCAAQADRYLSGNRHEPLLALDGVVRDTVRPIGEGVDVHVHVHESINKEITNNENKFLHKLRLLLHPGSVRIWRSIT